MISHLERVMAWCTAVSHPKWCGSEGRGLPVVPQHCVDTSLFGLQTVGESLLYMLENCLGAAFSPDVREAWIELYGAVVKAMQRGWEVLPEGD